MGEVDGLHALGGVGVSGQRSERVGEREEGAGGMGVWGSDDGAAAVGGRWSLVAPSTHRRYFDT